MDKKCKKKQSGALQKVSAQSIEEFVNKYAPLKVDNVENYIEVFKSNTPSLVDIKNDYGPEAMSSYLNLWFVDFNAYVGYKLDQLQIDLIVSEVLKNYYYFKIADLKFMFENLKRQKFYSITPQEILQHIHKYFDNRCTHAQIDSQQKSDIYKGRTYSNAEQFKERFDDFMKVAKKAEHEKKLNEFKNKHS